MPTYSIKELREVIIGVGKLIEIRNKLRNGFQITEDLPSIISFISYAPQALQGIAEIPTELMDLEFDEAEEMNKLIKDLWRVPDKENIEEVFSDVATGLALVARGLLRLKA